MIALRHKKPTSALIQVAPAANDEYWQQSSIQAWVL